MNFTLQPLPYAYDALAPYEISATTLHFHHDKHEAGYLAKLHKLLAGTQYAEWPLEQLILNPPLVLPDPHDRSVFDNAAQVWNHEFYWRSMKPGGGGRPTGLIARAIDRDFGSYDRFRDAFITACEKRFGSGWGWLTLCHDGRLRVGSTPDADSPLVFGEVAILTCDVWEHAYYLDYQNRRRSYVEMFLARLVNWDFANENLARERLLAGI